MELRVEDGLLIAKMGIEYQGKKLTLNNVLVDTGCSDSIFDTDLLAEIGLYVDYVNGMPTTMYGIGGKGEVCNQQIVNDLSIGGRVLNQFPLQLGITKDSYGFDGFIGLDFMMETNMVIDFSLIRSKL
ncbi:aspartyl protease family protein [Aquibacillus sp. 3ASR75-11]|uniref:Aspartyl protease family protein n=1 Tax=Terrihalobacillus insolitus TaxID=2950438 RepID=A0A9X3WVU7_9BACI|nr:aspartyl protease family protein [Terrihalobacillus insolitus]MDC3425151.1 aspartyl protease family protein [Terrihalobacillus insolitus]